MARAVLHIGLPKTGTSYVQQSLVQNREALAATGVEVLNVPGRAQHDAAYDLLGRRIGGIDARTVEGAWPALVDRVARSSHPSVLFSDEVLVHARPRQVRSVARSLGPRELHVVVTVRDLRRAITSMWEQETAKGRTIRWRDYVSAVRDPSSGPPTAGVAFWLRYDVRRILQTWTEVVPAGHVRVVVVPRAGSPPHLLFERFAEAVDLDPTRVRPVPHQVHRGASAVHSEVLRRLNEELRDRFTEAQYLRVVADLFMPAATGVAGDGGPAFPREHRDWVEETCEQLIDWLAASPYRVVGDLEDLRAHCDPAADDVSPDELDEDTVNQATRQLLVATMAAYATSARRRGPGGKRGTTTSNAAASKEGQESRRPSLRSRLRAKTFRARVWALERADRNRWLAKAANAYLRLTGRSRGRVG